MRAFRCSLAIALAVWLQGSKALAQRIAYDEFDGRACAGFAQEGLGEWAAAQGRIEKGLWVVQEGSAWRELAQPLRRCVVWYAVTLRMRAPIAGYASLVPAADRFSQFSELGFNSEQAGEEGLWSNAPGFQPNGLECTTRATFLQRYDLVARTWDAWCLAGDGLALLDERGQIDAPPDVDDAPLAGDSLAFLYLSKISAQELEVERVALAASAREALTPAKPGDPVATLAAAPLPPLADELEVFAGTRGLLRSGDRIAFYGDSITMQGGFIDVLEAALARVAPDKRVEFQRRGVDGATSADLLHGAAREITNCEPFSQRLAQDRPTLAVIFVGINDVAFGGAQLSPESYAENLRALVESARACGASVVLCTPALRGEHAPRAQDPVDARLERFAAAARRVALERHVGLCDLRAQFLDALSKQKSTAEFGRFTYDGVHMNAAGNQLIAERLAWAITVQWFREAPVALLPLVPYPSAVSMDGGEVDLGQELSLVSRDARGLPAAQALARALTRLGEFHASVGESAEHRFVIEFVWQEPEFSLEESAGAAETYALSIDERGARIGGGSPLALARGASTLLQLIGGASLSPDRAQLLRLPKLHIFDQPRFAFRGLLLDVARRPHSIRTIEQLIDLCSFYKIGFLQLHLSDDSAFTFPSRALAELCTPAQTYSREELRGLSSYAHARGVELIPELEMPGHAAQLVALRPDLFAIGGRQGSLIDFCNPAAVEALETLVDEVCEVFPSSRYVHLGGDECDLAALRESPHFAAAGIEDPRQAFADFLASMNAHVRSRGRRAMVWEGFGPEFVGRIPRDLLVVAWDSAFHAPQSLLDSGFSIVNAAWRPLYVVNEKRASPAEIYSWNAHHWSHWEPNRPASGGLQLREQSGVLGAMLCAWEQAEDVELESLLPRLAPLGERLWNPGLRSTFVDFELRRAVSEAVFRRCFSR